MKLHARGLTVLVGAAALTTAVLSVAPAHAAATRSHAAKSNGVRNPYSPAYSHSYRHGVIPTRSVNAKMKTWSKQHAATTAATGPETLSYGGGVDGIGVQSGHSKVYLVFYGTQWGTSSTDANGNLKFTGDSAGAAGVAQQMFKGIGTNNELWSADLTQWCDGPNVASGATSCPSNAAFVPYQSGGVLSGVWYDNSKASPSAATAAQLGQEAVNAAAHFGNTTAASNRYAYYVILSPHGTNPDNYQGQYCAWHDYNGDVGVSSPYGDIAFSNQPYNIDSGAGLRRRLRQRSAGTTDGYTMTLGHEWHEMMSDQNPAGGWTNHTGGSYNGQENSDECAWLSPGTSGGAANVSFATGTFAEQASWSNDTNNCAISHPIVGGGTAAATPSPSPTPAARRGRSARPSRCRSTPLTRAARPLTYSATGLPAGRVDQHLDRADLGHADDRGHVLDDGHGEGQHERVRQRDLLVDDLVLRRWRVQRSEAAQPGLRVGGDQLVADLRGHQHRRRALARRLRVRLARRVRQHPHRHAVAVGGGSGRLQGHADVLPVDLDERDDHHHGVRQAHPDGERDVEADVLEPEQGRVRSAHGRPVVLRRSDGDDQVDGHRGLLTRHELLHR